MYLGVSRKEKRFGLCFGGLNDRQKGTNNAFSSYKQTSKLYLAYLEVKLKTVADVAFSNKNARKR